MLGDGTTTYLIFLCTFPLNDTQEKGEREGERASPVEPGYNSFEPEPSAKKGIILMSWFNVVIWYKIWGNGT